MENCWEYTACGREPGGSAAASLGVCPAATEARTDGANRGTNGGRVCWLVAGTLCGGEVQGSYASKLETCFGCSFYQSVQEEEGDAFESAPEVLTRIADPQMMVQAYEDLRRTFLELKTTQSQLVQAQKLEALGSMAAGIAHEINTPAQYIGDNLAFLRDAFDSISGAVESINTILQAVGATAECTRDLREALPDSELDYLLSEIPSAIDDSLEGTQRIASIVQAVKSLSHPGTGEIDEVDINEALHTMLTVAANEWKHVASVVTEFDEALPAIEGHPQLLSQVFLNIIVNAAHALGGADVSDGVITVRTRKTPRGVEIDIEDNGPGIPEEIVQKIFDPFFTTKDVGKGSGQGLALAHSAVESHGGAISVNTEVGAGTTFTITLPLTQPTAGSAAASA